MTSRWVFINTGAVTKLFGISLANPLAMVMEYFEDGQLDVYLSRPENRSTITEVNLVEASASLANALYYLVSSSVIPYLLGVFCISCAPLRGPPRASGWYPKVGQAKCCVPPKKGILHKSESLQIQLFFWKTIEFKWGFSLSL